MKIEEAGPDPRDLANAIHHQLSLEKGEVPIREIAFALDIIEIRDCEPSGFEGALVTTEDRNEGAIAINSASSVPRRNYTIAHELLHFLNPRHQPADLDQGFLCTKADIRGSASWALARDSLHYQQEMEANRFAIEVLAPRRLFLPFLEGSPDLGAILAAAKELGLSRQAAARRFIELSATPAAVIFTRKMVVQYSRKNANFPTLAVVRHQAIPRLPSAAGGSRLSKRIETEPTAWLRGSQTKLLTIQTLWQQDDFATTLLTLEAPRG